MDDLHDTPERLGPQPAGRPIPTDDDAILDELEAAYLLNVSVRTLQQLRQVRRGPPYVQVTERRVGYTRPLLRAYRDARVRLLPPPGDTP
jgi:hypothetical protein